MHQRNPHDSRKPRRYARLAFFASPSHLCLVGPSRRAPLPTHSTHPALDALLSPNTFPIASPPGLATHCTLSGRLLPTYARHAVRGTPVRIQRTCRPGPETRAQGSTVSATGSLTAGTESVAGGMSRRRDWSPSAALDRRWARRHATRVGGSKRTSTNVRKHAGEGSSVHHRCRAQESSKRRMMVHCILFSLNSSTKTAERVQNARSTPLPFRPNFNLCQ